MDHIISYKMIKKITSFYYYVIPTSTYNTNKYLLAPVPFQQNMPIVYLQIDPIAV